MANPFKESAESSEGTSGADKKDSSARSEKKTSIIHRTVQFIIKNGTMIVIALGICLAGSLGLLFLNARKQRNIEFEEDTMDHIPIQSRGRSRDFVDDDDDDDEGPRRVLVDPSTGKPRQALKRDDSEYALVVDEEELHLPHHDDGSSSGEFERIVLKVQESIEKNEFEEAYNYYQERIQTNKLAAFHAGLERRLGKYYLKMKNFKKAAQILQHHVSTQPATEVEPEIYFDLGYIYFKEKTLEKSRHFFQMFADRNRDQSQNSRALKLIQSLEKVKNLG